MSLHAHYVTIQEKHGKLKARIAEELVRPSPDLALIQVLKKQKLLLKEELERLRLAESRVDAA
ncbi:MAG: DUF465 domain-containing protein [Alphaproteobacteria bacterium]|nr:DUF465 domain-containing protein [Alphaproteobacteria bacterium]